MGHEAPPHDEEHPFYCVLCESPTVLVFVSRAYGSTRPERSVVCTICAYTRRIDNARLQ